jgi:hypothetical protein
MVVEMLGVAIDCGFLRQKMVHPRDRPLLVADAATRHIPRFPDDFDRVR